MDDFREEVAVRLVILGQVELIVCVRCRSVREAMVVTMSAQCCSKWWVVSDHSLIA